MTRPRALAGITYKVRTACGSLYVTCNSGDDGALAEVFVKMGNPGGCAAAVGEGFGRLISNMLQAGGSPQVTVKSLAGIGCHAVTPGVPSCLDAIAGVIKEHLEKPA